MMWTSDEGFQYSYGAEVTEELFERVINYGSKEKPFRLRFRKVIRIGFLKGLKLD